ncbi:MAG TPA: glycosyltransferase [Methanoregula sp.]|nr:glycosyltransferase [Methanoregula sp.]
MKIAIFHDYFGAIGGGEKVVIEMAKCLDADIITTDTDAVKKIDPHVRVISLGKTIQFSGLKQVSAAQKFYFCDFSKTYDLFIFSGNWAHYAAHRHHPNLWYCHTPVRAFYDNYERFLTTLPFLYRIFFRGYAGIFQVADKRSVSHIDHIVANSHTVLMRTRTYYNRESDVVYPPVDTLKFQCSEYGDFWLSVNRLYPEKQIELQIECFRTMPEQKLVIAGGFAQGDHAAAYAKKIQTALPPNVSFLGEIPDGELCDLFARCRGLICTAEDEDFGLTPLEAMAAGKPVVAMDSGGFRETVTPQTGILVNPDISSIIAAVRRVSENPAQYHDACIARAREFDLPQFAESIKKAAENTYSAYQRILSLESHPGSDRD